jgi:phosphatidate cytidylyltransferase
MSPNEPVSGGEKPARTFNFSDLGPRIVSALALVAVAVATLVAGGATFAMFWLAAGVAVLWEWQRLVGGERQLPRLIVGGAALTLAATFAAESGPDIGLAIVLAAAGALAALAGPEKRVWAGAGMVYAGVLVVSVIALRNSFPYGLLAVAWLFAVVWGTDVLAYFGGRLIGGPKFWPRVSPSKTWSGTLSGVFGGALFGLGAAHVVANWSPPPLVAWTPVLALGLVVAIIAQAGDFFESAVKRRFGVKDSSNLIPGHGGVMDRLDGFITAAAGAALIGALRGLPSVSAGLFHWP